MTKQALMLICLGFNTQNLIMAEQKKLIISLNEVLEQLNLSKPQEPTPDQQQSSLFFLENMLLAISVLLRN